MLKLKLKYDSFKKKFPNQNKTRIQMMIQTHIHRTHKHIQHLYIYINTHTKRLRTNSYSRSLFHTHIIHNTYSHIFETHTQYTNPHTHTYMVHSKNGFLCFFENGMQSVYLHSSRSPPLSLLFVCNYFVKF